MSLNLPTNGNKAALILRLNQADPTGQWIESIGINVTDDNEIDVQEGDPVTEEENIAERGDQGKMRADGSLLHQQLPYNMELEFARRENELMRRELELAQRENELLRLSSEQASEAATVQGI